MKIRAFEEKDCAGVQRMITSLAAFHGDSSRITERDVMALCAGERPWFTTLVAEQKGALIGYAAILPMGQLHFATKGAELHHLFVDPSMRGQSVGARLVHAAVDLSKDMGATFFSVGTDVENTQAQRFYEGLGMVRLTPRGPRFAMHL